MSKVIANGFILVIVFTALAHGAVEAWSVASFALLIILLLGLWAVKALLDQRLELTLPTLLWPMLALLLYGVAQSITVTRQDGQLASLSMDVEATRHALPVIFFLLVSFVLAANFFNTAERWRTLLTFMMFFGFALALFALIQNFTWNGKLYWLRTTPYAAVGPFVNRNHYAGFMEMLVPLPLAFLATRAARKELWMLYIFVTVVMALSVVLSLSRGGVVSMLASVVFLVLANARRKSKITPRRNASEPQTRWRWLKGAAGVAALAMILGVGLIWLGAEPFLNRVAESLKQTTGSQTPRNDLSREWIWRNTLTMIGAHKVFGVGLGAYETAFPAYRSSDAEEIVMQSHNDYLQIVADCGMIGAGIAVWFLVLLCRAIWRGIHSPDAALAAVALGSSAGIFAMLIHSFFDFNLQIPSNALWFLTLCALVSRLAMVKRSTEKSLPKYAPGELAKIA
ncbi:MAG: O-antigen ligase family protein [Acidobacteria bacterium]|nr:O-antigen ligase family protein [Acidobacteriota bacterium]